MQNGFDPLLLKWGAIGCRLPRDRGAKAHHNHLQVQSNLTWSPRLEFKVVKDDRHEHMSNMT